MRKQRIYLDYAATTPLDPAVERAMAPFARVQFGNPSSLHSFGQEASAALDTARETVTRLLGASFCEVVFTSSATEANNLALRGVVAAARKRHPEVRRPRIVVSSLEHESILETARELEKEGVEVVALPVDQVGRVHVEDVKNALTPETVLVSVMYANNEVGTVQPIKEISDTLEQFRKNSKIHGVHPLLHTDAVQAFQYFDCAVRELGVDMMTLSAHKIYGPKGAGALHVKSIPQKNSVDGRRNAFHAITTGGGQEFDFRSGTENVPAIVGFAEAVKLAGKMRTLETKRLYALRDYFWKQIKKAMPKAQVNGPPIEKKAMSAPHILNVYFPGKSAQELLTRLDLAGVAASSGSACSMRALQPSYAVQALGHPLSRARSSVRFSFGRLTTKRELDEALAALQRIIHQRLS